MSYFPPDGEGRAQAKGSQLAFESAPAFVKTEAQRKHGDAKVALTVAPRKRRGKRWGENGTLEREARLKTSQCGLFNLMFYLGCCLLDPF